MRTDELDQAIELAEGIRALMIMLDDVGTKGMLSVDMMLSINRLCIGNMLQIIELIKTERKGD